MKTLSLMKTPSLMKTLSPLLARQAPSGAVRPPGLSLAARSTVLLLVVVALTSAGLAWFGRQTVLETFAAKEVDLVLQNRKILEQAMAAKLECSEASRPSSSLPSSASCPPRSSSMAAGVAHESNTPTQ